MRCKQKNPTSGMLPGKYSAVARIYRLVRLLIVIIVVSSPATTLAQVSSNEINYFSRCRIIRDVQARAACYDDLYDRAVRAVAPHGNPGKLMEENRRMREELARIQEGKNGSMPATGQGGTYGNNASHSAPPRAPVYSSSAPYPQADKAEAYGKDAPYVVKGDNGKEELIGRIASLQKCPTGWIVTLEKGQVWRQMLSKHYLLRAGQEVRIYPTVWGKAYRLSALDGAGYIQVERIQ